MKKLVCFSLIGAIFVLTYVLIVSFLQGGGYQKNVLKYHSSIPLLLGKGHVFYTVQINDFPFSVLIDKLTFFPQKNKNRIEIEKLTIPVLKILKDRKELISANLDKYIPYHDMIRYPMETLALMDIENLTLNGKCDVAAFQEKWTLVNCEFEENVLGFMDVQLTCTTEYNTPLEKMICPEIKISLLKTEALKKYQSYASFLGTSDILEDTKNITLTIIANENFYLKDIFQNKDFSFEIRK